MLSWSRAGGDRVARIQRLADDLVLIDTDYQRSPESIAVYLLLGDRPALIETGPASPVETVLQGVRAAGLDPRDPPAPPPPAARRALSQGGCAGVAVRADPPGARRPRPRREGRRRAAVGIAADESAGDAGARQPPSRLSG